MSADAPLAPLLDLPPDGPTEAALAALGRVCGADWVGFVVVDRGGRPSGAWLAWPDATAGRPAEPFIGRIVDEALRARGVSVVCGAADEGNARVALAKPVVCGVGRVLGVLVVCGPPVLLDVAFLRIAIELVAQRCGAHANRVAWDERARRAEACARAAIRIGELLDTTAIDVQPALVEVCAEVARALGVSSAAVTLLDRTRGVFVREAFVGLPDEWLVRHPPQTRDEIAQYAHFWQPIGVFEPPVLYKLPEAELYRRLDLRAIAQTILKGGGETSGILSVLSFGADHHFDADERLWIEGIGHRVAQAVRAARLTSAIAASEARYRQMVESCLEGIWVVSADLRITFANAQMGQLLGYKPEELMGRSPFDFMDEAAGKVALELYEDRRRGIGGRRQARYRHRLGHELWFIVSSSPIYDEQGRFAGVVAFFADVTERRLLEQRIQQKENLESLGVLAGGIAHDFNNLLVGVLGNVSLARRELARGSPLLPLLEGIETAGLRAAELTRQLLAYAGKGQLIIRRLDVNALIREMAGLVATIIPKTTMLELELADDLPPIEGDATQIRQIVMNLITNASDALGGNAGVVRVRSGVRHADRAYLDATYVDEALPVGKYLFIEVADPGCGMDAATVARIFEPFFTTKFAGRGLGLAAVLGILRSHHGAVRVESAPGKGSTFTVLLPVAAAAAAERAKPRPGVRAPDVRPRGTVLVVDDEQVVRNVAQVVLERAGFAVELASDGDEAIERVRNGPGVAGVLLDVLMPGRSVETVIAEIKRLRPELPILLTSGHQETDVRDRLPPGSFAGFLPKPWEVRELCEALDSALGVQDEA